MRLGGRLAAAIEILDDIDRRYRPAADALRDWGLSHRFAGSKDRAAIGNIVYDALRRKRSAGWIFQEETPRALAFGALLLQGECTPDMLNAALAEDSFAPPPLSSDEIARIADHPLDAAPDGVRAESPEWCEPLLKRTWGDDWVAEAAALSERPPLDMRTNTLRATRDQVAKALASAGALPCDLAPQGLRVPAIEGQGRHPNVQSEQAFRDGWFEVQDEGSQIVAELTDATPGMQVLDFCAGAGGKSLAMSAAMGNTGQIHAFDADRKRLAPIIDRLKRAGCRNVQAVADEAALAPFEGRLDLVVVDAPCTGAGTWRRRPDAKWRLGEKQLEQRQAEQAEILAKAARFVRPGGRLAYITCSVFAEENEDQVRAFIKANPAFRPVDHEALWERHFPGKAARARIDQATGIALSPHRTATDGFHFAALERV
ncbi:RsmB/NOP family class I SAM-dependent RNA methyltransferase [Nitratireductor aquimarinus]|uniref:RsmB/NOP family class I SAM-dependent RNA methyltransferase n=1 Tax=Nitratireductor aquimarinus TaxID=889300 RepID=UPI001A8CD8E6|nr:RsmB/NOP family class I SAM-dependent RNA methyltransferase [Nitratireductor aquimarinus]MBN8242178.1 RsmB/NOP family class I SAM-dependent RNA methyltransferase [Nitratireductor aquimarinus]MBY6130564.1 RsmB/NOP family class I SAM-dependent RNA methyltransferase [Nitratireductor aquimarinus]MCA1302681.1 RsmB/NOP family class I SAM-dependent RNA methyltransferase [Nitratireductor aquimarinus]